MNLHLQVVKNAFKMRYAMEVKQSAQKEDSGEAQAQAKLYFSAQNQALVLVVQILQISVTLDTLEECATNVSEKRLMERTMQEQDLTDALLAALQEYSSLFFSCSLLVWLST